MRDSIRQENCKVRREGVRSMVSATVPTAKFGRAGRKMDQTPTLQFSCAIRTASIFDRSATATRTTLTRGFSEGTVTGRIWTANRPLLEPTPGGRRRQALLGALLAVWVWGDSLCSAAPPDARPVVLNGSFEDSATVDGPRPAGWYFLRQAELVEDPRAPVGKRYLRFTNAVPGRTAQAQQHFALDGRTVRALDVGAWVRLREAAPGQSFAERPAVRIQFFDASGTEVGAALLGPWAGTRGWSRDTARFAVPYQTRLALIVVGLRGGTGQADFDSLDIAPARQNPSTLPPRIRP